MQERRLIGGGTSHIGAAYISTQRPLIIPKKKPKKSTFELFLLSFFAMFILVFLLFASIFLRHKMHNDEPEWAIEVTLRRDSFMGRGGGDSKGLRGDNEGVVQRRDDKETLIESEYKSEVLTEKETSPYRTYPHSAFDGPTLVPTMRTYFGRPCNQPLAEATAPPGYSLERHVCLLPTHEKRRIGLKQDLRVLLDMEYTNYSVVTRPPYDTFPATNILGEPRGLTMANNILLRHPLNFYPGRREPVRTYIYIHTHLFTVATSPYTLEDIMDYMKHLDTCYNKPIFLTMATVGDELYWQLIENFVYTMVKFNVSECSLVICVSDPVCMSMCQASHFPCFDYHENSNQQLPHVMEQIAAIKLYHIPKALLRGVDVFMLDLDVGFLSTPISIINAFYKTPDIDIIVQEDYLFIMNRTKAGWKTWFTEPLPNIGLFLCRGNERTAKVFSIAWDKYQNMADTEAKHNPGKDQNHVLEGMRIGRGTFGLRYGYLSNETGVLLDKMCQHVSRSVELGGLASSSLLTHQQTLAIHTTCYEQTTKVMGLKASNSFWNPKYYDPLRPTLTKQILFVSDNQVLEEIRSLMWLAVQTGRALITPNLLGHEEINTVNKYHGHSFWPGFRVSKMKRLKGSQTIKIDVLEPGYYWRVDKDYDVAPQPAILYFDPTKDDLISIKSRLIEFENSSRVVLHGLPTASAEHINDVTSRVTKWSVDSVGYFELPYSQELMRYGQIPSVKKSDVRKVDNSAGEILQGVRNCVNIFGALKGNRTCFQICD